MMQGTEETRRALEDLREYCSSPECDTWRLVSRLQNPTRYEYHPGRRVLPVMALTGRLRPKRVPFSRFRCMKE